MKIKFTPQDIACLISVFTAHFLGALLSVYIMRLLGWWW